MYERPSAVIRLEDVHLTLSSGKTSVRVLNGISFSVLRGQSVSLIGPSGSGKSTLLMVMAGLERADRGSIVVAGTNLSELEDEALTRYRGENIGIVFQSFHLIPTMTALENVAVPLEISGVESAFDRARTELEQVGLHDRLAHYPAQLSGGEQQRVAIARALAPNPALILADEPTGNLDSRTGKAVVDLMFERQIRSGMTLFLVTHDRELAERCDRQMEIQAGALKGMEWSTPAGRTKMKEPTAVG